jgi:thiamine pyrophosphate-dependent acetolactate synthase large subunit-like protein
VARVEGSALVAQALQREGIEVLFGLEGGPIQDTLILDSRVVELRIEYTDEISFHDP